MCLRAVIMLRYVPAGLGDKLGAWPQSRSAGWRIWVLAARGAFRKAAWRSWPSSSGVWQGGSGGHGIRLVLLALRAPSERRSAPALPSLSLAASPLPHLLLHSSYKQPARKGLSTRRRAHAPGTRRGGPGGKAGPQVSARHSEPNAVAPSTAFIPRPGRASSFPPRPAPPGSSLLDFTNSFFCLLDFFAQSRKPLSCPSSACWDRTDSG